MNLLRSRLLRAFCLLVVGVLLVMYPDRMTGVLVMLIGVLFFIPGVVSVLTHFYICRRIRKQNEKMDDPKMRVSAPFFPIAGVGSVLMGIILMVFPEQFINSLMYLLGALLVLVGLNQMIALVRQRKVCAVSWMFYVLPLVVLGVGVYTLFHPSDMADVPFVVLGSFMIVHAVSETIGVLAFYKANREAAQRLAIPEDVEEAQVVEEEKNA